MDLKRKASIHCYSLNSWQKWSAISICALAIIVLLVGVSSVGGTNVIGTKAAWAMVGSSIGVGGLTIGGITINHLLYVKQVGKFLESQMNNLKEWEDGSKYPDDDGVVEGTEGLDGTFEYTWGGKKIYGKRYAEINKGTLRFYIEFHRIPSIHHERT